MNFYIISLFPESFKSYFDSSILKRAQKRGLISIKIINPRKFTKDKHKTADDKSYGGGPGMVLKIEPIVKALNSILRIFNSQFPISKQIPKSKILKQKTLIVLFSAVGKQFDSNMAQKFAKKFYNIIMICGRYEGVDERIKKIISDLGFRILDLSIGPYVLSGGELPAAVVVEAISRHIPRVLGKSESLEEKRHGAGVPVYTRPEVIEYEGRKYRVPKILLSGDRKKIEAWRNKFKK